MARRRNYIFSGVGRLSTPKQELAWLNNAKLGLRGAKPSLPLMLALVWGSRPRVWYAKPQPGKVAPSDVPTVYLRTTPFLVRRGRYPNGASFGYGPGRAVLAGRVTPQAAMRRPVRSSSRKGRPSAQAMA